MLSGSSLDRLRQLVEVIWPRVQPVAFELAGNGRGQIVFHDLSRLFGHENIELFIRRARFQPPHEKAFCDLVIEACAGA